MTAFAVSIMSLIPHAHGLHMDETLAAGITSDGKLIRRPDKSKALAPHSLELALTRKVSAPAPPPPRSRRHLKMEIGGEKHADEKNDNPNDPVVSERPEFGKARRCKDDKCQECISKIECWHGVDVLEDVLRPGTTHRVNAGRMHIDAIPSSSFTSFAFDVWTRCASGTGNWYVSVERLANGKVSLFSDSTLLREFSHHITQDHVAAEQKRTFLLEQPHITEDNRAQLEKIPVGGNKRVRVVFSPHSNDQASSAEVLVLAWNVDSYVEECMAVKDCMGILGDGGEAGYELRSKNEEQLKCLEGKQESLSTAVAAKCNEWRVCLPTQRQLLLRTVLRSVLLVSQVGHVWNSTPRVGAPTTTASAQVWNPSAMCGGNSAGSRAKWLMDNKGMSEAAARDKIMKEFPAEFTSPPTPPTPPAPAPPAPELKGPASFVGLRKSCIDPAFDDPESLECECAELMIKTCDGVDEECFRRLLCENRKICDEWKEEHCQASPQRRVEKEQMHGNHQHRLAVASISSVGTHELLERRVVSNNVGTEATHLSNSGGLDDTLQGKCSSETQ